MYRHFFKRLLDIVLSLAGLAVFLIPMLIVGILVMIDSPGPALFLQKRVGRNRTYFNIIKFRSMPLSVDHDMPTDRFSEGSSLSRFQTFIRKYSIDELPQLVNILVGHMSIIGPRPALWNQYNLVEEREKVGANSVRPGLTGWAQINGRDELSDSEKARYDGEYVSRLSFAFDVKCFFMTLGAVIHHRGVSDGTDGREEKK